MSALARRRDRCTGGGIEGPSEAMEMTAMAHTPAIGQALSVPVRDWLVQSSALVGECGEIVSRADYRPDGWLLAPARSTVMAALLANGEYPDVFHSTQLRDRVDAGRFEVPWWFRSSFTVSAGGRVQLRVDGVIHRAELWVNGTMAAGADELAGAYPVHGVDVTELVVPGINAMALKVMPGHPMTDLSVGWIDWNPMPPDANMGLWRDVWIRRTGDIRLGAPSVVTELSANLDRAALRIGVEVENAGPIDHTVTLLGTVRRSAAAAGDGPGEGGATDPMARIRTEVAVPAGQRRRVVLTPDQAPELAIDHPAVWWPIGQGSQPLHELHLQAGVAGEVSDQQTVTFGIRQVTSHVEDGGGRRFVINGRPIQVLGAGWCPDIFLRHDRQRLADQLGYVVDLGLNAIRLEGKLENPEFFDLTDRLGIMVLPGWECCTKWESHAGTGGAAWTDQDRKTAGRSMASEARLLRSHPSVIAFLIGSDFAPPCELAEIYLRELRDADWSVPVVSSGASRWNNEPPGEHGGDDDRPDSGATAAAGPSGMKMWPYDWVPPCYWYQPRFGGAVGFDSECSAGHSIPRMPSLSAMLDPGEIDRLWQQPDAHHYHAAPSAPFSSLAIFHHALAGRYGPIGSLRDFLRKSQLANYEAVRAQFEAYRARATADQPATGVIYWMLNSAWPSLNWQLFDHRLDPAGSFFGARKANEPVHVQLSYDTSDVVVVNALPDAVGPFTARATVRSIDGSVVSEQQRRVEALPGGGVAATGPIEIPDGISTTYFVELALRDGTGKPVSRNVYWCSTQPDTLDWEHTTWQYTPQSGYADLTGLADLAAVRLELSAVSAVSAADSVHRVGAAGAAPADRVDSESPTGAGPGEDVVTVTVRNPSSAPAVGIHLSVVSAATGLPVAPIHWEDNDITLFDGQHATVTVRFSTAGVGDGILVRAEGFNVVGAAVRPRAGRTVTESAR